MDIKNSQSKRTLYVVLAVALTTMAPGASAMHPKHGATCKTDKDCLDSGWETCKFEQSAVSGEQIGKCHHKDLWPLNQTEMWGFIMTGLLLFYTNIGGLAGGGIHMPILIGFFRFPTKLAVPVSNAAICVSALSRFFWNINEPHPLKNGKGVLVDHGVAMLMMPMVISGVSVGVILNIIMPDAIQAIVFSLIVGYFSIGTGMKAYALY